MKSAICKRVRTTAMLAAVVLVLLAAVVSSASAIDAFGYQKLVPASVSILHQPTATSSAFALVTVEGGSVRYTVHGANPSAGGAKVGNILYDRDTLWLIGGEIKTFRVIQTTPGNGAEVRVTFYK